MKETLRTTIALQGLIRFILLMALLAALAAIDSNGQPIQRQIIGSGGMHERFANTSLAIRSRPPAANPRLNRRSDYFSISTSAGGQNVLRASCVGVARVLSSRQ